MKKISKILFLILSLILILSFSGCAKDNTAQNSMGSTQKETASKENTSGSSYPLKIKDSYNREVIIEKEPQKIISIAPNISEIVFALGKQDKLVGRSDYCDYPKEISKIQSIGNITDPSIEKITELKPDLVIASTHFKKEVIQKLEDLNIKVVVFYGSDSFEGAYDTIQNVGKVLNANEKSKEIVTNMQNKVTEVEKKVKDKGTPSVYYVVGFGQSGDFTAGKDTFIGKAIEMAGGKNAAGDVTGWKYSIEKLMENNPEIMICSNKYDSRSGIQKANGYKDLAAVKNNKLYEIDNDLLDRQGPRVADGLEAMAKIIHPEAFK